MRQSGDFLRNAGLTNHDTADLGELAGTFQRENRAYCTSRICGGGTHAAKIHKPHARFGSSQCPDCKEYLFWKTVLTGGGKI